MSSVTVIALLILSRLQWNRDVVEVFPCVSPLMRKQRTKTSPVSLIMTRRLCLYLKHESVPFPTQRRTLSVELQPEILVL